MTSHDAVFKICKILKTKKIGHGGTLDPDVVGFYYLVAVGKATRLVEFMAGWGQSLWGWDNLAIQQRLKRCQCEWLQKHLFCRLDETIVDEAISSLTGPITRFSYVFGSQGQWSQALWVCASRSGSGASRTPGDDYLSIEWDKSDLLWGPSRTIHFLCEM